MALPWHLSARGLAAGRALAPGSATSPRVELVSLHSTGPSFSRQHTHHRPTPLGRADHPSGPQACRPLRYGTLQAADSLLQG